MMEKDILLLKKVSNKFTEESLKDILTKETGNESVEITGWNFEPGVLDNSNYMSIIHKVTINYVLDGVSKQLKVVIKALPENEISKKTLKLANYFESEINFYSKIVPAFNEFLESKTQKNFLSIPKCLQYYCDGNNDYIVLEDLRVLGYKNVPQRDIWKIDDIRSILKIYSRFHAVSFAYQNQSPSEFLKIAKIPKEAIFKEPRGPQFKSLFNESVNIAKDAISKEYRGTHEEQKFYSLSPDYIFEKAYNCIPHEASPTSVITHGDPWSRNFMVRTSEATGECDAIFYDFQLIRYASPIVDISIVLYAITDKEIRDKHFNDLLKYYHDELSNCIVLLGSDPDKIYPWDLFMKEIKKQYVVGFCCCLPGMAVLAADDTFDMENVTTEEIKITEAIKIKPIKSKEMRKRYADMIIHALELGCI